MLFNSPEFIFGFLPAVLALFFLVSRYREINLSLYVLTAASIFFYGWWNWWLVLLLIGSVVAFLVASEILVRTSIVPNHNDYKYADLFQNSPARNVIFGDSHAAYSLTGIEGFVNLAYGGNNFESITGKVSTYFKNRQPGKIILQAGVHHFSRDFLTLRTSEQSSFERFLIGYPAYIPRSLVEPHRKEIFGYWNLFLRGQKFVPVQTFMPDGSRLGYRDYSTLPRSFRAVASARTAKILEPVKGFENTPTAHGYARLIDSLRARDANICLVTFPVVSHLRQHIPRSTQYQSATRFFAELSQSRGIRYVNHLLTRYPDKYFSDPHHLNARGAKEFSTRVHLECFG